MVYLDISKNISKHIKQIGKSTVGHQVKILKLGFTSKKVFSMEHTSNKDVFVHLNNTYDVLTVCT